MIGSNYSLKAHGTAPHPSPVQASQPRAPQYGGQSTVRPPQYIGIDTTEDAANNVLASGVQQGDQRYQMKQLDRAGFSRGRGQQYAAAQQGQQEIGQAASQAAEVRAQDQKANSQMRSDYERMREQEAMSSAMAAHSRGQADWSVKFARQQAAAGLLMQALTSPLYTNVAARSLTKKLKG